LILLAIVLHGDT